MKLALLPLQAVLFPDGRLNLKVVEPRYQALMTSCLRSGRSFGVVTLKPTSEHPPVPFESIGCLAELVACDSPSTEVMHLRCQGVQRFDMETPTCDSEGLWHVEARLIDPDPLQAPSAEWQSAAVQALARALDVFEAQGKTPPVARPHRFHDAGWVANRWCELLPIPTPLKYQLMTLPDPRVRLQLVDGFLRRHGIVKD
ncbi:MAG: LON peptidase substrate-binding domain-containing protein [Leptothrix ochracea]|uniref:LON peptidase substrate-binding domain-containing protein n=1 Tax=Leptothrix ochracea TaxID=735331 RepID=UPI0034E25863